MALLTNHSRHILPFAALFAFLAALGQEVVTFDGHVPRHGDRVTTIEVDGPKDESCWYNYLGTDIDKSEMYACIIENALRREHQIPQRITYTHLSIGECLLPFGPLIPPTGFYCRPRTTTVFPIINF